MALFNGGVVSVDDLLAIRGILVGVSFGKPAIDPDSDVPLPRCPFGSRLFRVTVLCTLTDGDPAIVGSWCRLLRLSACFCIELMVCDETREDKPGADGETDKDERGPGLRFANFSVVAEDMADI